MPGMHGAVQQRCYRVRARCVSALVSSSDLLDSFSPQQTNRC
eukprot:COSAG02_NODE_171_length_31397_cov_27.217554_25_plen_42_part_00